MSNFSLVDGTYKFYNFNKCRLNECKVHCRSNNLILPLNHVKSTVCNKNFSILTNSDLSCKSNNIVYLITCSVCKIQYVGETGRNFDIRMSEHIKFIERKSKNMRIYQHFTNDEHFTDNNGNILPTNKRLRFQIIESIKSVNLSDGDARKLRLNRELYWISKMKTAYPLGLNEKIEGHGLFGNASDPSFTKYNLYKVVNDCETKKKKKKRGRNKKKGNINDEQFELFADGLTDLHLIHLSKVENSIFSKQRRFLIRFALSNHFNKLNHKIKYLITKRIEFIKKPKWNKKLLPRID